MERSPCPGLNALANEGKIPENGRHVKLRDLVDAIGDEYNIDWKLAAVLASFGIIRCGNPVKREVNLHDLALHNAIEHDFSLFHGDAQPKEGEKHVYAPTKPDEKLLDELCAINGADRPYLFEEDFIKHRQNLREERSGKKLNSIQERIASGEILFIMHTLGRKVNVKHRDETTEVKIGVRKDHLRMWALDEKLPKELGWEKPPRKLTFSRLQEQQKEYKKLEDIVTRAEQQKSDEGKDVLDKIFDEVHDKLKKAREKATDIWH